MTRATYYNTKDRGRALCNRIRWQRMLDDRRWQETWAVVPLETLPEQTIPANQEDRVYLNEVIAALSSHARSPEVLQSFVENCDAHQGQSTQGRMSRTEASRLRRTRAWVRAWAKENG